MERSSGSRHTGKLAPVFGAVLKVRSRQCRSVMCGDGRSNICAGRSSIPTSVEWSGRQQHEPRHRSERPSEARTVDSSLRGRAGLCNGIGTHCAEANHVKREKEEGRQLIFRRKRGERGGEHRFPAERDMARRWYWRRQEKKGQRRGLAHQAQVEEVCHDRAEERQPCTGVQFSAGRGGSSSSRCWEWGPTSRLASAATGSVSQERQKRKRWPKAEGKKLKVERLFEREQLRSGGRHSAGSFPSCAQLPEVQEEDVPGPSSSCSEICPRDGGRAGSKRSPLSGGGLQPPHPLGEATQSSEVPLSSECCDGGAAEGRARACCTPVRSDSSSSSPGCVGRWRLADSLAPDPCRGPVRKEVVRRHPRKPSTRHRLPAVDGGACQGHREPSQKGLHQRRSRGCREGEGRQGQKERSFKEREGQAPVRDLRGVERADSRADDLSSPFCDILHCLEDSKGSFGRFWKLIKSSNLQRRSGPRTPPVPTKEVSLFPSLLVLPEYEGKSRGARKRARRRGREESWRVVEIMWAYFTFLDAGSPYRSTDQQRLLDRAVCNPWTALHSSYAGSLHDEIHRYIRLQSHEVPLSRGILKLSELVKIVRNSDYTSSHVISKLARVAKSVKPDRMSLPEQAGIIDPKLFLKEPHLEAFNSMASQVPHGIEPARPTVGCFKVEPEDTMTVNHKLLSSGVATLIPESLALRDSRGNVISGGLFAVDHKPESDRVILDRRPFNELERRLVWARLPHGSLLTQLIVPRGYSIRGSGDDLSNYFYLLKHNQDWLPRNTVGHVFDGEGYEAYGGKKGEKYLLSFKVIAMGDLNAVDIAQQVHFEILQDGGCMQDGERIEFKQPLPATHTLEGLYIDDHIVTQILPSKKNRPKGVRYRDEELIEQSRRQYSAQGIPTSEKKAFQKADTFTAWGTEVDNKSGRVGAPLIKLKQLASLLTRVCSLPTVSQKLLQSVVGLLIHPFMHRRSTMCLLQDTFLWVEKLSATESKPLPIAVKEELLACALLMPLCHSNIRWTVSCRIGASDASLSHGGRAAALVSPAVAQTLYRYSEHRGESVRLNWEKGEVQPPSSMNPAPKELEDLLLDLPWNKTETCSFGHKQHINILETKMIHRELRDLVHSTCRPLRSVLLVDSRAAAGAWAKGRSSARNLNRILRQSLGWTLVGKKTLHLVWVRSEANPSDYPSRCRRIPEPPANTTPLTKEVFGDSLGFYRARKSNRQIWRSVGRQDAVSHADSSTLEQTLREQTCLASKKIESSSHRPNHPAQSLWSFREIFAGSAHLTQEFRNRKTFNVSEPFELMKKGKVRHSHDILDDVVFDKLCGEAKRPKQVWHFGFPCGSFSIMQNMNKGTRTCDMPLGDGSLKRERDGNEILRRTLYLCQLLHDHGSFFTLENPLTSLAWKVQDMQDMIERCNCKCVRLDQCQFGLQIPDEKGRLGLAKKPTLFVGTLPNLEWLNQRCQHQHDHVAVLGGVKVQGKWKRRSQLAGSYPRELCRAYVRAFEKAFK